MHQLANKITISPTLIFSTRITVARQSIKLRWNGEVALIARSLAIRVAKSVRLQRCSWVSCYSCRCTALGRVAASGLVESSHLQGPSGSSTRPHSLSATALDILLPRIIQGRTHFPCPVDPSLHFFPDLHLYFPVPARTVSLSRRKNNYGTLTFACMQDSLRKTCSSRL